MPVTLLRWKSGAAGDTILKLVLDSNPTICSQNRYISMINGKTEIDGNYVLNFKYNQVANMSTLNMMNVDKELLIKQLNELNNEGRKWLLKTHYYSELSYPLIDIVVGDELIPFVVKASLTKNSRDQLLAIDYHPLVKKIKNKEILYKFDCFNHSLDIINTKINHTNIIQLNNIINGWGAFISELDSVGLYISPSCKNYYDQWLIENTKYLPSEEYISLVSTKNYNYDSKTLSIEERYSLLALSKEKFKILQ